MFIFFCERKSILYLFIYLFLFRLEDWAIGLNEQKIRYKIVILSFYIFFKRKRGIKIVISNESKILLGSMI